MPPPAARPARDLEAEFTRLRRAARSLIVNGRRFDTQLHISRAALFSKEAAARIAADDDGGGYVLLTASMARGNLLFFHRGSPLRVKDRLSGDIGIEGPLLVLARCAVLPTGQLAMIEGHVRAVSGEGCFLPIATPLLRDVTRLLRAVQEGFDRFGIPCMITRPFDAERQEFRQALLVKWRTADRAVHRLLLASEGMPTPDRCGTMPAFAPWQTCPAFILQDDAIASGRLTQWLITHLVPS